MTKEEINRQCAEMLGWHVFIDKKYYVGRDGQANGYVVDSEHEIGNRVYFNPAERWDHAMMALEKFKYWILEKRANCYVCDVFSDLPSRLRSLLKKTPAPEWHQSGPADTAPMAICLAALEAVKDKS